MGWAWIFSGTTLSLHFVPECEGDALSRLRISWLEYMYDSRDGNYVQRCHTLFFCITTLPLQTTLEIAMETRVPKFVSTMSRTIKCNYCSKLFVNQQGLFYTVKLKTKNVLYLQMIQHTILYLSFSKSQPRLYS